MGNTVSAPSHDEKPVIEVVQELRQRHHELGKQLDSLNRHLSLTPAEQIESARLKKEKLLLKDRIAALGGEV